MRIRFLWAAALLTIPVHLALLTLPSQANTDQQIVSADRCEKLYRSTLPGVFEGLASMMETDIPTEQAIAEGCLRLWVDRGGGFVPPSFASRDEPAHSQLGQVLIAMEFKGPEQIIRLTDWVNQEGRTGEKRQAVWAGLQDALSERQRCAELARIAAVSEPVARQFWRTAVLCRSGEELPHKPSLGFVIPSGVTQQRTQLASWLRAVQFAEQTELAADFHIVEAPGSDTEELQSFLMELWRKEITGLVVSRADLEWVENVVEPRDIPLIVLPTGRRHRDSAETHDTELEKGFGELIQVAVDQLLDGNRSAPVLILSTDPVVSGVAFKSLLLQEKTELVNVENVGSDGKEGRLVRRTLRKWLQTRSKEPWILILDLSEREAASVLPYLTGMGQELGSKGLWREQIFVVGPGTWRSEELTAGQLHVLRDVQLLSNVPDDRYSVERRSFITKFSEQYGVHPSELESLTFASIESLILRWKSWLTGKADRVEMSTIIGKVQYVPGSGILRIPPGFIRDFMEKQEPQNKVEPEETLGDVLGNLGSKRARED